MVAMESGSSICDLFVHVLLGQFIFMWSLCWSYGSQTALADATTKDKNTSKAVNVTSSKSLVIVFVSDCYETVSIMSPLLKQLPCCFFAVVCLPRA